MTRADILQEITQAKINHKRWVKRADHLISGLPVDKEFIPLDATSCSFGMWLYSQGTQLRTFEATRYIVQEIEEHHDDLHDTYGKIYNLYFIVPENRSILSQVWTFGSKKIRPNEMKEAKKYFKLLKRSSNELLMVLNRLEEASRHLTYEQMIASK